MHNLQSVEPVAKLLQFGGNLLIAHVGSSTDASCRIHQAEITISGRKFPESRFIRGSGILHQQELQFFQNVHGNISMLLRQSDALLVGSLQVEVHHLLDDGLGILVSLGIVLRFIIRYKSADDIDEMFERFTKTAIWPRIPFLLTRYLFAAESRFSYVCAR